MNGYVSGRNSIAMNDRCILINGEKETVIWCGRMSVSTAAFYGYGEKMLRPDILLAVHTEEYSGEEIMEFEGIRYAITRTYERFDGLMELTGTKKAGLQK